MDRTTGTEHSFTHRRTAPPSDGGQAESRRPLPQPQPPLHRTIRDGVRRWHNGYRLIETTSRCHVTSPKPGVGPSARGRAPPHFPRFPHVFSFLFSLLFLPSNRFSPAAAAACRTPSWRLAVLAPEASPIPGEASPAASSPDEPLPCELSSPGLPSSLLVSIPGTCAGDRGVTNGI